MLFLIKYIIWRRVTLGCMYGEISYIQSTSTILLLNGEGRLSENLSLMQIYAKLSLAHTTGIVYGLHWTI